MSSISTEQLVKLINSTPLDLPLHQELLMRASHSHLMDVAYTQYTLLWQKHPNDASANLLRGGAAEYLGSDCMMPELHKFYSKVSQETLFPTANVCLAKAVDMVPDSPVTNMEYGFFLWQFGNKLPQGLKYLKKALVLAPNEPRIHTIWGNVYANPDGDAYDLQKAINQLNISVKLDPTYALTHNLLANIYTRLGQTVRAEQQTKIYQSLLP